MGFWLCVTTWDNWLVVKEKLVWGVSERFRNAMAQVKPGDELLMYVMQHRKGEELVPSKVMGAFKVVSEPFKDSTKVFKSYKGSETYPYRVKLEPLVVGEKGVEFKPLVPKLSFVKNKRFWSGSLRRAMVKLPERDYKLLLEELRRAG